jgi:tellurite resistance protein
VIAAILKVLGAQRVDIVAGVVAAVAIVIAAYQTGVSAERKRGEAAALRAELAIKNADLAAARHAAQVADQMAQGLERAAAETAGMLDALRDQLAKRPAGDQCQLSPADAARLRGIR